MKRFNLGFFPTPLQELKNLSATYKGYRLYIKRDDHTGLASGGNKTRKLEFLIQEAIDANCDTIITAGAQQSNHCRQTAAACAIANLNCHLLLGGTQPTMLDGNLLLSKTLGATIHYTGDNRKGEDIKRLANDLKQHGFKPYIIPYGGSNNIGAMGYVEAVKELKEQLICRKLKIDYIFFASSSGGMQAGLLLGKELYKLNTTFMPINIDKDESNGMKLEEVVLNIVNAGKVALGIKKEFTLNDIELIKEYDKAGYGVVTDTEKQAIHELATKEGILVDPVYTARALGGMLDYLKRGLLKPNATVLFWHTGGFPAFFHYADQVQ